MKKYILITTLFVSLFTQSQTYVNGKKVSDEAIGVNVEYIGDEIYVDGKPLDEYIEDVTADIEEETPKKEREDPNLYQSKNVDAYNKWYNTKGKKMIEEKKSKTKNCFLWVLGILGAGVITVSLVFIIAEIRKRLEYRRYKKSFNKPLKEDKPRIPKPEWSSPLHNNMDLPEVDSPIRKK